MNRPSPHLPADMRILELAGEHLRKFGSAKLTVVGLAEELGMSHANVYRYFPSKEGLLEAVTTHWVKPIETGLRAVAEGPDPARDKLERLVSGLHSAYRDKLEADPEAFEVFLNFFRKRAGLARKHRARVQAEARRVLEEGMATSAFAGGDPGRAVALVLDATHRFIHPLCVAHDQDVPRAHMAARLERVLDSLLAGLTRRSRGASHVN
jgi:AcrR family transcriptional regulator